MIKSLNALYSCSGSRCDEQSTAPLRVPLLFSDVAFQTLRYFALGIVNHSNVK